MYQPQLPKMEILINKGKNSSLSCDLNYFAKSGNIYIMDNHLAAIWCWEKLPRNKRYSLFHIDAHYDLGECPPSYSLYSETDLSTIPITELTNFVDPNYKETPYFQWDNYLHLFNRKYKGVLKEVFFITQRLDNWFELEGVMYEELDIWNIDPKICFDNPVILNLDIDYFFEQNSGSHFKLFNEDLVYSFAKWLALNRHKFEQITIALSPECCGGWNHSINMANLILSELNLHIDL